MTQIDANGERPIFRRPTFHPEIILGTDLKDVQMSSDFFALKISDFFQQHMFEWYQSTRHVFWLLISLIDVFLFPLFRQPSQTEYMLTSTGKCTARKTARLAGMQDGRQVLSETMQLIRLIIVNVVLQCLFFI